MKISKKRISALIAAAALSVCTAMSASGEDRKPVRDANGDGEIRLNDAILTHQYLAGKFNPTNIKSFDFDGNGIISKMDADKVQHYTLHLIGDKVLPDPSTETVDAVATTRSYMRHYYSNNVTNPVTEYSLTVDPYDNIVQSSSDDNRQQRTIIDDNDMIRDYDTAVVNLWSDYNIPVGTGFIISDHVIATAAHCVYTGSYFNNLKIKITDSNNKVKTITPKYTDLSKTFYTNYSGNYSNTCMNNDYALIYVEEDLSEYGSLKMGVALDEYVNKHGEVIVSGFPRQDSYPENYDGQPAGLRFKAKGRILSSTLSVLRYDADTYKGDSGGPVYAEEGFTNQHYDHYDYKTVIAIDIASNKSENTGLRITPDILKFYYNNSNIDY